MIQLNRAILWRFWIILGILVVVLLAVYGSPSDSINQKNNIPSRKIEDIWKVGENWDYVFFIAGKEVGQQKNLLVERIVRGGKSLFRFKHDFQLDTRPIKGQSIIDLQSESLVDEQGHPQAYHANVKVNGVPQVLDITFEDGNYRAKTNIAGREQAMEGKFSPDGIMMDNNIIGHLAFLFGIWELKLDMQGKRHCFVPTRLKEIEIDFAVVQREDRRLDDQTIDEVFTIEIPELDEIIQVSSRGIVLNLQVPKQLLEIKLKK